MGRINWPRVLVAGLVTGFLWFFLSALLLALFAQDFLASVGRPHEHPRLSGMSFFAIDLLMGVWTIWLYASIRSRYGPGLKTALIAGFAWWTIKSLQSLKWAGLGFIALKLAIVPFATTLVAALSATIIGAYLYNE